MADKLKENYFQRLVKAILGRESDVGVDEIGLKSRMATMEMELKEKDQQVKKMQAEYTSLEQSKKRAERESGQEHYEELFKKLSGPLSNIAALAEFARSGQDVKIEDLLKLIDSIYAVLNKAGLEKIGTTNEITGFDSTVHQRMSGGSVHPGTKVILQIPGYRMGDKILQKALVTKEGNNGEGSD